MPDADRHWDLHAKKKKKQVDKEDEVKILSCPECYAVFPPLDSKGNRVMMCPHCGYQFPEKQKKEREEIEEENARIEGKVSMP